jgi:hypothetical protein
MLSRMASPQRSASADVGLQPPATRKKVVATQMGRNAGESPSGRAAQASASRRRGYESILAFSISPKPTRFIASIRATAGCLVRQPVRDAYLLNTVDIVPSAQHAIVSCW